MVRWRRRRAGGLLVMSRGGLLPMLVECTTNPALLERIVEPLSPARDVRTPSAGDLFARPRGNIRDALRELYDLHAAAPR